MLRVSGTRLVADDGSAVRLRGVGLGGWMNMENFVTGYPANESAMRAAVRAVLGDDRAELFFDRLLTSFFTERDAALLAGLGMNCVRIPVNYRHWESDDRPMEIDERGSRHLDRVIGLLIETEFQGWNPYPWGARYQSDDLIRHILIAQALLPEYAELFRGLGDDELTALADSFSLEQCVRRRPLLDLLAANLSLQGLA
ncbi:hypothetical protein AB0I81_54530 [Nonomuraea sp. NPDC050404]|uniref:hypothetical protein n=1 Tax=Nonomuraea sp. NPDC050404 TaxID=3155783 RepID=UPI00340B9D8A